MRMILVLGLGCVMACSALGNPGATTEGLEVSCAPDGGATSSEGGSSRDASAGDAAAGDGASVPGTPGYLHTSGGNIVDASGNVVRLTGVSWFGLETANYAPHGLWSRPLGGMLDQIKSLGFNVIRLPFCNQLFDAGSTPNGIDTNQNPDLVGLTGLQLMDKVVAAPGSGSLPSHSRYDCHDAPTAEVARAPHAPGRGPRGRSRGAGTARVLDVLEQ